MSGTIAGTTSSTSSSAASRSSATLATNFNTFLTLLTTQLQNQDPTNPMDTEQLTQQLVQFSSIEQQIQGNQTMERLLELQQAGQLANSGALIGRRVVLESNSLPLQDKRAEVLLPPAGQADIAVIQVQDAAGNLVRSEMVKLGDTAGRWVWDGKDSGGRQRQDGTYRVSVVGRSPQGEAIEFTTQVAGIVTGATRQNGELVLRLGNTTIGYDRLREVPGT